MERDGKECVQISCLAINFHYSIFSFGNQINKWDISRGTVTLSEEPFVHKNIFHDIINTYVFNHSVIQYNIVL